MPYLVCARCQVETYSAALWSSVDRCPACGAELARSRASAGRPGVIPLAAHPRFSPAVEAAPGRHRPLDREGESA